MAIFKNRPGELDLLAILKGQFESLFGIIEVYCNNRYSSPSTELRFCELIPNITEKFSKYKDIQVKANALMLEIRAFESQVKRGALSQEKAQETSELIQRAHSDIFMTMQLYTEQLTTCTRTIQSMITREYSMIMTGADLLEIYKERQRMKCKGKHYTIKFKLLQKDQLLDTNNIKSKEDESNGADKRKKS